MRRITSISEDMQCLINSDKKIKYVIVDVIQGISKRWIASVVEPIEYTVENGEISVNKSVNKGNFYIEKDLKNKEYITIDGIDYYMENFHRGVINEIDKPIEKYKRLGVQ